MARYLQVFTTLSVSIMAWMCIGYGIFEHTGPAFAGWSDIALSGFQDSSKLGHSLSQMTVACSTTIIVGAGSAGAHTRMLSMLIIVMAAVGVPVAARAVWIPHGTPTMLLLASILKALHL